MNAILRGGSGPKTDIQFPMQLSGSELLNVVEILSSQPHPLYAILDAARDPAIYTLLLTSGTQYYSLYFGRSALELATVAPYLVGLPPHCELLEKLVAEGWSKAWGVFLTSTQPPETIRHELRRSLMVTMEGTGKLVYFRFYDPRVLRVFLPVADPQQRADFNGSISSFLVEDKDPNVVLRFHSLWNTFGFDRLPIGTADLGPGCRRFRA